MSRHLVVVSYGCFFVISNVVIVDETIYVGLESSVTATADASINFRLRERTYNEALRQWCTMSEVTLEGLRKAHNGGGH